MADLLVKCVYEFFYAMMSLRDNQLNYVAAETYREIERHRIIKEMQDESELEEPSILPKKIRGNHYHNTKTEKFVVISGKLRFNFVNILTKEKFSLLTDENIQKYIQNNFIIEISHLGYRTLAQLISIQNINKTIFQLQATIIETPEVVVTGSISELQSKKKLFITKIFFQSNY